MNKKLHLTFIAVLTILFGFSQDLEKIKGSRNVVTEITELSTFNSLVVGEGLKIKLLQGLTPSVQIEADDNLFEAVGFDVQDANLKFDKLKRITSSKRFNITVIFKDSLNIIELKNNSEIASGNNLKVKDFTLVTNGNSKAFLTLEADDFKFINNEKSRVELNVSANEASFDLRENSNLKALVNASLTSIKMDKSAYARLEGDTNDLDITIANSSILKAEKLTAKNGSLIIEDKADAYIDVRNDLKLEASGTTETYIYGSPKIELNKFENSAILRKK